MLSVIILIHNFLVLLHRKGQCVIIHQDSYCLIYKQASRHVYVSCGNYLHCTRFYFIFHQLLVFLKLKNFDPFLMLDEFKGKAPGGFPDHPHRGFETVGLYLSPNPSIKM